MQNYVHKHKNKSLEEILHVTRKKEPELLGYNEEPIKVEADISVEFFHISWIRSCVSERLGVINYCMGLSKPLEQYVQL
jgi:hypothetical protein